MRNGVKHGRVVDRQIGSLLDDDLGTGGIVGHSWWIWVKQYRVGGSGTERLEPRPGRIKESDPVAFVYVQFVGLWVRVHRVAGNPIDFCSQNRWR